jgi:hypothetical protein
MGSTPLTPFSFFKTAPSFLRKTAQFSAYPESSKVIQQEKLKASFLLEI